MINYKIWYYVLIVGWQLVVLLEYRAFSPKLTFFTQDIPKLTWKLTWTKVHLSWVRTFCEQKGITTSLQTLLFYQFCPFSVTNIERIFLNSNWDSNRSAHVFRLCLIRRIICDIRQINEVLNLKFPYGNSDSIHGNLIHVRKKT